MGHQKIDFDLPFQLDFAGYNKWHLNLGSPLAAYARENHDWAVKTAATYVVTLAS